MLIICEVQPVGQFSPNRCFLFQYNLIFSTLVWPFDHFKLHSIWYELNLKLIWPHFQNHSLKNFYFLNYFYESSCSASTIFQIKFAFLKLNFCMKSRNAFIKNQNCIRTVSSDFCTSLFHREKATLRPIILLDNKLELFFLFLITFLSHWRSIHPFHLFFNSVDW